MPDLHYAPFSDLRLRVSRRRETELPWTLLGSAGLHLWLLALLIVARVTFVPLQQPEQPAFGVVFEPSSTDTHIKGAENPTKYTQTPNGEKSQPARPTPRPPSPPPTPETQAPAPPQVNLLPPEMMAPEPPPQQEQQAEELPRPTPNARRSQPRPRASQNPFAHPMEFSLAPQARPERSGGIPGSRSLDLSAGPVIRGGRLQDAVAHVIGPGGSQDYMDALSEYIELHKYYPPSAAKNGEEGISTLRVTIARDGTVRAIQQIGSSGSSMLDSAWQGVFRGNRLPPFPDDLPGAQQTFTLSLDYHLIYGR